MSLVSFINSTHLGYPIYKSQTITFRLLTSGVVKPLYQFSILMGRKLVSQNVSVRFGSFHGPKQGVTIRVILLLLMVLNLILETILFNGTNLVMIKILDVTSWVVVTIACITIVCIPCFSFSPL